MPPYQRSVGIEVPRAPSVGPLDGIGAGLQEAGKAAQDAIERQQVVQVSKALADTKSKWTQELIDRQQNSAPGAPGFQADIERDFDTDVQNTSSQFRGKAKDYYDSQVAQLRGSVSTDAKLFEVKEKNADLIRTTQDTIDTQINTVRTDPKQYDTSSQQIDGLLAGLHLPADQIADIRDKSQQRLAASVVQARIAQDPDAALKALNSGAFDDKLKPETKNTLVDQATRASDHRLTQSLAYEARQDRQATKMLAQLNDQADKDLAQKAFDHKLTRADVDAYKNYLKPEAYTKYLRMASGQDVPDDPGIYQNLLLNVDKLPANEFASQATQAFNQKGISQATYTNLINANTAANKDDQPSSDYKRGRSYISTTLDPGLFSSDPAGFAMAKNAQAGALEDFDKYVKANPGKSGADLQQQAKQIVDSYSIINLRDNNIARPMPPYVTLSKPDMMKAANAAAAMQQLDQAEKKVSDEEAAGTRDHVEAGQVISNIQAWRRSIQLSLDLAAEAAKKQVK